MTTGFMATRDTLYNEFFSALTSTAEMTSEAFFAACDALFVPMTAQADLLDIPGPPAGVTPCSAWQEMNDVRD